MFCVIHSLIVPTCQAKLVPFNFTGAGNFPSNHQRLIAHVERHWASVIYVIVIVRVAAIHLACVIHVAVTTDRIFRFHTFNLEITPK